MAHSPSGISVLHPDDPSYMRLALREAERAFEAGEVPVGALVVHKGRVIGKGFNQRETLEDPTAHAEMLAITAAAQELGHWRLEDCTLYVTLEPCPMCAGAIVNARIARVVFGASDPKAGACGTLMNVIQDSRLNHRAELVSGVLAEETGAILKEFFRTKRKRAARESKRSGEQGT